MNKPASHPHASPLLPPAVGKHPSRGQRGCPRAKPTLPTLHPGAGFSLETCHLERSSRSQASHRFGQGHYPDLPPLGPKRFWPDGTQAFCSMALGNLLLPGRWELREPAAPGPAQCLWQPGLPGPLPAPV